MSHTAQLRVLVVSDDEDLRTLYAVLLRDLGGTVTDCHSCFDEVKRKRWDWILVDCVEEHPDKTRLARLRASAGRARMALVQGPDEPFPYQAGVDIVLSNRKEPREIVALLRDLPSVIHPPNGGQ